MIDFFSSDQIIEPTKGDLLISEPYLPDPNFERTVVLLCEHDENGSIGFILNKPATVHLADVMDDLATSNARLFVGGPVQQDTLHFIHRSPKLTDLSNEILPNVRWGGNFNVLTTLVNTKQIEDHDLRFFVGYSGWSEGQLNDEIREKSWIVFQKPSERLIFDVTPEELWKQVLQEMGGKFKLISNYPLDPRLN